MLLPQLAMCHAEPGDGQLLESGIRVQGVGFRMHACCAPKVTVMAIGTEAILNQSPL